MNGITLRNFENMARQNESGVITLDKGDPRRLINNKGTLGRAIVCAFKDLGQALGLGDSTRAHRQAEAFKVFHDLLKSRYGAAAAGQALQQAGLTGAQRLKAGDVDRLIGLAARARQQNLVDQSMRLEKFNPPIAGGEPSDHFLAVLASFDPPVDLSTLSDLVRQEYSRRLSEACKAISNLGVKPLKDEAISGLARSTLKHVLAMQARGQLDDARSVRDSLCLHWKGLLLAIGRGAHPQDVMDRLDLIRQHTVLLLKHETGPDEDIGSDFFEECAGTALIGALSQLRTEEPALLRSLLDRALDEQGALKSIYLAVSDGLHAGDEHGSLVNLQFAGRLQRDISTLIGVLTSLMGTRSGSGDDNMDRLGSGTQPRPLRQAGVQAFEQARLRQFDAPRDLIQAYVSHYGDGYGDLDLPLWYSTEALSRLERDVFVLAERLERDPTEVLRDLRVALDIVGTLPAGLKERLGAAFDAIEAGLQMHQQLDGDRDFGGLAPEDHWRLFAPGNLQDDSGKWVLEQNGQGTLAAMQRAFLGMLQDVRGQQPLDDRWLERIQRSGSQNSFRDEDLRLTYTSAFKAMDVDGTQGIDLRESSRVPSGYRDGGTDLNLRQDGQVTPAGREELRALAQDDPWFQGIRESQEGFAITFAPKTPQECRDRARDILARHEQDMAQAQTEEDKLAIIGRTTQDLYRSHVFMDGNTRTNVFIAMNGLLLKAGLSPCILAEPKAAAGFSRDEFVQEIRKGQLAFQQLTRDENTV